MDSLKKQIFNITNPALRLEFIPCDRCAGVLSPRIEGGKLCGGCLHNKAAIEQLQRDVKLAGGIPLDNVEALADLSPTERQYLTRNRNVMKHLGDLAETPGRAVLLECRDCVVSWYGCAAVCCCPECGEDMSEQLQPSFP